MIVLTKLEYEDEVVRVKVNCLYDLSVSVCLSLSNFGLLSVYHISYLSNAVFFI